MFPGLDLAKLAMSLFVVAIHTGVAGSIGGVLGDVVEAVFGTAVPFFFMASGFLCFLGMDTGTLAGQGMRSKQAARVRRTILGQLRLYLTWTFLYVPVTVFGFMIHGTAPWKAAILFVRNVLLVGENFCSWPLWYLLASVVGFGLVYAMLRRGGKGRRRASGVRRLHGRRLCPGYA